MYSCMLMAEESNETQRIRDAFEKEHISIIHSKPCYANYVKTLQYLPDIIVIALPALYSNELNYVQMVKQHHIVSKTPIICYGADLPGPTVDGLKKIGVDEYCKGPIDIPSFAESIRRRFARRTPTKIPAALPIMSSGPGIENDLIAQLLSPKNSSQNKINLICGSVANLMAFPFAVSKVLKMSNDGETSASDLAKVIESDPVLAAKMLQVSNSAFFGGGRKPVSSVKNAVVRIGFTETRRIVMGMTIINLFDNEHVTQGFNRVNFWYHCLSTAVIAEYISERIPDVNKDEAFLCGLLHDFGILILDEYFPRIFSRLVTMTTDSGAHFIDKEREMMGITHLEIARTIFSKWNIPSPVIAAVAEYATAEKMLCRPSGPIAGLPVCVALANQLSKALMLGAGCDLFVVPLPAWMWEMIDCTTGLKEIDKKNILTNLDLYQKLMNITVDTKSSDFAPELKLGNLMIGVFRHKIDTFSAAVDYLRAKGHSVEFIERDQDFRRIDNQFDFVMVEAGDSLNTVDLSRLASLLPKTRLPDQTKHVRKMPLLMISSKENPITMPEQNTPHSVLYRDCDLRNIDLSVGLLMMADSSYKTSIMTVDTAPPDSVHNKGLPKEIAAQLADAVHSQTLCRERKINNEMTRNADTLVATVHNALMQPEFDVKQIGKMLQLINLNFKKALLQNELQVVEDQIDTFE